MTTVGSNRAIQREINLFNDIHVVIVALELAAGQTQKGHELFRMGHHREFLVAGASLGW
jgi:hypothetical protein